jgi:hypothetical protein
MSYIDSLGVYHKESVPLSDITPVKTSVWKHSDHSRQRADHKMELLKPWNADGTLNDEFIQAYPEEAKVAYGFNPDANLELRQGE